MNRTRIWAWAIFGFVLCPAAATISFLSSGRKPNLHVSWIGSVPADRSLALSISNSGPDGLVFEPRCDLLLDPAGSGSWHPYPLAQSNWLAYGGFISAGHQITMRWSPPTSGVPARVVLSFYPSAVDPSRPVGRFANLLFDLGIQTRPTLLRCTSPPVILP